MQNPDTDSSNVMFGRWIAWSVLITIVVAVVGVAIPARFRFHGLLNVAMGLVIGTGCRWIAGDVGPSLVNSVSTRWKTATALVMSLALAGQIVSGVGGWLQYRAMVYRAWKNDPTTMITAQMIDGEIATTESNGQKQVRQMQQLFNENTARRSDALKTRSGFRTWIVKRVDNKLGIKSSATATAFWFGEICLGCLAALFGFVGRPRGDPSFNDQTPE